MYRRWLRQQDLVIVMAIVAIFAIFFAWLLMGGRYLVGGDAFLYSHPMRVVAWDAIRQGTIPLWTPFLLSGYPLLAMSQVAIGYPLTWGYLFLPSYVAEQVYVLAPFLLAPLFTYAYARELGRSQSAAFLAGLAFGYGGASLNLLGVIGFPNNAQMWLPLVLIALERSRTKPFGLCVVGATTAFAMSILTGYAQSVVIMGLITAAYALHLILVREPLASPKGGLFTARRWQPFLVAICAIGAAGGLAAFQILETLGTARGSVRSILTYEMFGEGSFTFSQAVRSFLLPLYTERFADVTSFVPPLVFLLAVVAVVSAFRSTTVDLRIWFWFAVAIISAVLMLGPYTPLYKLAYQVPLLNQFRVPSRHAFEWTFALSILGAYGWDSLKWHRTKADKRPSSLSTLIVIVLLVLSGIVAALWWRATGLSTTSHSSYNPLAPWYTGELAPLTYLGWKSAFTVLTLAVLWQGRKLIPFYWRQGLLLILIVLICLIEPYIMVTNWWPQFTKDKERLTQPASAMRLLIQNYAVPKERVYTRIQTAVVYAEEQSATPRIDGPNVTAMYGLHNVAGYEPLILERYSRAFGNVFLDGVTPRRGPRPIKSLLDPSSHVLDMLNTRYIITYADLATTPEKRFTKEGFEFAREDVNKEIQPGETIAFAWTSTKANKLAIVSSLSNSVSLEDNSTVAGIKIVAADGSNTSVALRAGVDTAEWAHQRPDVSANIKHKLAPVFDCQAADSATSFPACRYWTVLSFEDSIDVVRIDITNVTNGSPLALWKLSLFDNTSGSSHPLPNYDLSRWRKMYDDSSALILENIRVLPRAWLVAEAEAVDGEEALRRIRGESDQPFDPRRTALLEVAQSELPSLPGGSLPPESQVRFASYEANRLVLETESAIPTVLVLSEIFYPGWEAHIDGKPTRILLTNYLLRGIAVPSGKHRIEMFYRAPAARNGAIISACTLLLLITLGLYSRRRNTRRQRCDPPPPDHASEQKNQ
ncbi:MAG TPA: YfhO family protein [Pyrinomonadaceae bacterium]|nr:YfhO family protein [Pyrinomonadaceae bacterium]